MATRALSAFWYIWDVMDRLNLGVIAAGVAFYAALALFPTLAAVIMLWSWFADPHAIEVVLGLAAEIVPEEVYDTIGNQAVGLINAGGSRGMGWATVLTLGFAFWSAYNGVSALIRGLNAAYDIGHRASLWRRTLADVGVTLAVGGFAIVAIAAVVVAPVVIAVVPLGPAATVAAEVVRWIVAVAGVMVTLGMIYRFGPNRRGHRPRWITPGAIVATVVWILASVAFSVYLGNFGRYNEIYGSLGAAVALLVWLYLSAFVVLLGGCLNAAIEAGGAERLEAQLREQEDRAAAPPPRPVP